MIELNFLKELTLIKQVHQENVIWVTNGIFQIKALSFNSISATDVMAF